MNKLFTIFVFGMLFCNIATAQKYQKQSPKQIAATTADNGDMYAPLRLAKGVSEKDYTPNTLIIKVKAAYRGACQRNGVALSELANALQKIGATNTEKIYPNHTAPSQERNAVGQTLVDLTLIYRINYTAKMPITEAANAILKTGMVEYAEPDYIYELNAFTPNDASIGQQTYLSRIKAFDAWDLALGGWQGDTSTVVAIVDSGTDTDHPDLAANLYKNWAEIPNNGIDDDGDGYIDNRNGWDLAGALYATPTGDNNPNCTAANNNHGSAVSGDACAVTNNGIGVAGTGFKCRFMPVKCAADNDTRGTGGVGYIIKGYEGITYAADHNCQIINCSWGGPGGGTYGQDVINYATFNKNALVVCAAGNNGTEDLLFPASFNNAFSIAATNSTNDNKASFSQYNYSVDLSAPGNGIYNTIYNNSYASESGTSMASPITAGAAALVKSKFPALTALQIGERLRATSDNVYTGTNAQPTYKGKLGRGRLNMANAIKAATAKSVRMQTYNVTDGNDGAFVAGETLTIKADFRNYLDATTNLTATLSLVAGNVTIQQNTATLGAMATMATANNNSTPFTVLISPTAPANQLVTFKVTYVDGTYTEAEYFTVTVNVDYLNVHQNMIATTVTSKGRTGYNGENAAQGQGFVYRDSSLLYEMGLMCGTSATYLSDNVRGASAVFNSDFTSTLAVRENITNPRSDKDLYGSFTDGTVNVDHKFYVWNSPGNEKYVIVEYKFKNASGSALNGFYAGLFADWDITAATFANNKTNQDVARKMGYAYGTNAGGVYAAIKVLTPTPFNHFGLDNTNAATNGVNVGDTDGFSKADKYLTLSTSNPTSGNLAATGNDIHDVVSTGPFDIPAGDSITVAFALIGGDNVLDIQTSADAAQVKYDGLVATSNTASAIVNHLNAQPNPAQSVTNIQFDLLQNDHINLSIFDMKGAKIKTVFDGNANAGAQNYAVDIANLANGTYIYTLKTSNGSVSERLVIQK